MPLDRSEGDDRWVLRRRGPPRRVLSELSAHAQELPGDAGLRVAALRKLLARHGLRDPGGDGVLECRKRFLFLPGRVRDERSLREGEGGFGFLEEVRGLAEPAPPGAQLRLFDLTSDQPPAEVPGSWQPGPRAWAKGQGEPLTPDSGWSCVERYALRFATQRVELDDGGGYVEWSSSEGTRSPL